MKHYKTEETKKAFRGKREDFSDKEAEPISSIQAIIKTAEAATEEKQHKLK